MEENYDYIDRYFKGELLPGEVKQFDQRVNNDSAFAEEVAFYLSAKNVLKEKADEDKKKYFLSLLAENDKKKRGGRTFWLYAAVAAAVVAIVFVGWYFFNPGTSPSQLADNYISDNYKRLGVTMGVNDSLQQAVELYNKGEYAQALQHFEQMISAGSKNEKVERYAGIVSLQLKNYDKALTYFRRLANHTELQFNPGVFLQALTFMKRNQYNDKQQAKQLLDEVIKNDLEGKEVALRWIRKL